MPISVEDDGAHARGSVFAAIDPHRGIYRLDRLTASMAWLNRNGSLFGVAAGNEIFAGTFTGARPVEA
jgi:hypothetical protein